MNASAVHPLRCYCNGWNATNRHESCGLEKTLRSEIDPLRPKAGQLDEAVHVGYAAGLGVR